MDFSLNDEQKMMIDTVRRFIAEELKPLENDIEDKGYLDNATAQAIHAKSKALGLYGMNMPAELGGGGLSNLDRILCEEQFGHTSDILIRRAFGNVYEPLLHCKGEQVERWLKPAIEGTRTCAITITESGAGVRRSGHQNPRQKDRHRLGAQRQQTLHQRWRVV
jgi:acyl-CoA dehydrogenase